MNEYANMLAEYKQSEALLRTRLKQLNAELKKNTLEGMERESLMRRKIMMEQELYDMLDVMKEIYEYAGCGVNENCKGA